jgi:hypothetical protein
MNPREFVREVLNEVGVAIPDERAGAIGAADGFLPILRMFTFALRQVNTEAYEPLERPDFLKGGGEDGGA